MDALEDLEECTKFFTAILIAVWTFSLSDAGAQSAGAAGSIPSQGGSLNTFQIKSLKLQQKEPKDGIGVWKFTMVSKNKVNEELLPSLEVSASVAQNMRSDQIVAKAYFYGDGNKILMVQNRPAKAGRKADGIHSRFTYTDMPVLFYKDKSDRFFFEVPEEVRGQKWKAVVVFGDKSEMKSMCYPATERDFLLEYPEKEIVYNRSAERVARKEALDPLIETVIKIGEEKLPQMTLFLRPPRGVDSMRDVQGVMAISILGNFIDDVRRDLRKEELPGDYAGLFSFANKHKLAILAWSLPPLWRTGSKQEAADLERCLTKVADGWERGVLDLSAKYGMPKSDFLLWGSCASSGWAHRLCLRKPGYFLAIDIHLPGKMEAPTPDARHVLWCITTGELYGGYERSLEFVKEGTRLGYPIVFKAIPGLGHAGHPMASVMGKAFFEYALAQKSLRGPASGAGSSALGAGGNIKPWPEHFQRPPFYADIVNQEVYASAQADLIPASFRIPLPNKEIADIWLRANDVEAKR